MMRPLAAFIQQEKWLRALIEQSSDAIVLFTADGTILYASPSTTRVTGRTAQELVGMNGFAYVHPDELEYTRQRLDDLLGHPGEVITINYRLQHKDGSWRWMEGTATNLLHDPVIGAIVVNFRDITERKQIEEERAQLLAREQDFLRMVSHELRTPLQSIMGFVELALLYSGLLPRPLSPEAEELTGKIETVLKHRNCSMYPGWRRSHSTWRCSAAISPRSCRRRSPVNRRQQRRVTSSWCCLYRRYQ